MQRYESDIVIIGGGITAALVAQKLLELKPSLSIIVVEAGKRLFDNQNRIKYRQRNLDYGENIWPGDFVADQGRAASSRGRWPSADRHCIGAASVIGFQKKTRD